MKLYLLTHSKWSYDGYDKKLIWAKSEKMAREIANSDTGTEGKTWEDTNLTHCEVITYAGREGEVIVSYNAG